MAKQDSSSNKKATEVPGPTSRLDADGVEQRVVAFAEQLGRIVGTVQAKAEGWLDRDALNAQVRSVRDNAADLLKHLAGDETPVSAKPQKSSPPKKPAASSARNNGASGGRSGGVVDAPGKHHRKPIPNPAAAMASNARTANTIASKPRIAKMKASQTRGRGRG
jgi:hypothetical protein